MYSSYSSYVYDELPINGPEASSVLYGCTVMKISNMTTVHYSGETVYCFVLQSAPSCSTYDTVKCEMYRKIMYCTVPNDTVKCKIVDCRMSNGHWPYRYCKYGTVSYGTGRYGNRRSRGFSVHSWNSCTVPVRTDSTIRVSGQHPYCTYSTYLLSLTATYYLYCTVQHSPVQYSRSTDNRQHTVMV